MKKTIGVFFGSRSPEHDVSIITGQLIISGLKNLGYSVVPVYIDKKGRWYIGEKLGSLKFFTDPHPSFQLKDVGKFYLDLEESVGREIIKKKGFGGRKIAIDVAFPAFHGSFGEDGTIQGLFEMFQVPYVGCDVPSSAIAMDKVLTKLFYQAHGIPTTKFVYFTKADWDKEKSDIHARIYKLQWPIIVKPARLGSSIGIAKVEKKSELDIALEVALHYDQKVIIEECVENLMDITCAVLGNENLRASLLQESVFTKQFFSYEDKYLKEGGAQLGKAKKSVIIPARLPQKTTEEIRNVALSIYKLVGCSGTSRIDFLYDKKAKRYFANEINTLPGTLYHHLWKASGIPLPELLEKLIQLALERHEAKNKITYTFSSNLLKEARSTKLQLRNKLS